MCEILYFYTTTPGLTCSHLVPVKWCILCKQPAGVCVFISPFTCTPIWKLLFEPMCYDTHMWSTHLNSKSHWNMFLKRKNVIPIWIWKKKFLVISSQKFWSLAFKRHQGLRKVIFFITFFEISNAKWMNAVVCIYVPITNMVNKWCQLCAWDS